MILNSADNIVAGGEQVSAVYAGSVLVWSRGGGLPEGYTPLEYVECDGRQFLDPDLTAYGTFTFEAKIAFTDLPSSDQCVIGTWDDAEQFNYTNCWFAIVSDGQKFEQHTAANWDWRKNASNITAAENEFYNVSLEYGTEMQTMTINGVTFTADSYPLDGTPITLLRNGKGTNGYCYAKIYSMKLYLDGIAKRDFVPCQRDSDGVVGFFDSVSKTMFEMIR